METKENSGWSDCRDLREELLFEKNHRRFKKNAKYYF